MRAPISWLRDRVALPEDLTGRDLAEVFTAFAEPVQARVQAYLSDPAELDRVLTAGAERARLVTRLGWHGGAYLLPDRQIGQSAEHLHFYEAGAQLPPIAQAGTLEQWQQQVSLEVIIL